MISTVGRRMDSYYEDECGTSDIEEQKAVFKCIQEMSNLIQAGTPLTPQGNFNTELTLMCVNNHSPRVLEMVLSAGAPMFATDGRHNILSMIWLTKTSTTKEAVMVTRVSTINVLFK